jgi:hypothetical protein
VHAGPKGPVEVIAHAPDTIGSRLVYNVKEIIRQSSGFRIAGQDENRVVINIQTMEPPNGEYPSGTIFGIAWYYYIKGGSPIYMNHTLGWVGTQKVKEGAEFIVARTDLVIQDIIKIYSKGKFP